MRALLLAALLVASPGHAQEVDTLRIRVFEAAVRVNISGAPAFPYAGDTLRLTATAVAPTGERVPASVEWSVGGTMPFEVIQRGEITVGGHPRNVVVAYEGGSSIALGASGSTVEIVPGLPGTFVLIVTATPDPGGSSP